MLNLIFIEASEALTKPGVPRTLHDPTGGKAACSAMTACRGCVSIRR